MLENMGIESDYWKWIRVEILSYRLPVSVTLELEHDKHAGYKLLFTSREGLKEVALNLADRLAAPKDNILRQ